MLPGPSVAAAEAAAPAPPAAASSSGSGSAASAFTQFADNDYELEVPSAYTYYETPVAYVGAFERGGG